MILFLHHRYRVTGGEESAVRGLLGVVADQLGEPAELLQRDSGRVSGRAAAAGLLAGGLAPDQVAAAVRATGARIVHAHNLHPTFGWRALAAARAAGARTVLHLHQYRLVCATGVCFRDGRECTDCHGANTLPGIRHRCRGARGEGLAYAAGIALQQRRLLEFADALAVPSRFARERLGVLGVDAARAHVVPNVVALPDPPLPDPAPAPAAALAGPRRSGALVVSRLAPEKGVDVAVDACALAGIALTIAGDGPERAALERRARARGAEVRFLGRVPEPELERLRGAAGVAVVPSRSAETFGLAAAEAMAAGLPVAASRIGALPELVPEPQLATPGDPGSLAAAIECAVRAGAAPGAGDAARARVRALAGADAVAGALRHVYAEATRR